MFKRLIALFIIFTTVVVAENTAEKAKAKRIEALEGIVFLDIPLKNFAGDKPELKKTYEEIKNKYSAGLSFFFEGNYIESYKIFIDIQNGLEKLYEQVSILYIDRTSTVLQQAVKEATEVEVRYNRKSPFATRYVGETREASIKYNGDKREEVKEKRLYDPKEFHYLYDKKRMADNIDQAFMFLGQAKLARQQALDLDKYLEKGKKMLPRTKTQRIESYRAAIRLCRQAKVGGILVMQLNRLFDNYELQIKFKDNYFMKEKRLDPIFDFAIPNEYKVDANDSRNFIHEHEERIKIKGEEPTLVIKEPKKDTKSTTDQPASGNQATPADNSGK